MKKQRNFLPWIFGVILVAVILMTCRFTFVPDQDPNAENSDIAQKISLPEQYVIDNWDTKITPTIHERAVDMSDLIKSAVEDLNKTGVECGSRANETSAWSFCVKGTAKVIDIEDSEKPNKTKLLLDLEPYDGKVDCKLHYGKVFSSNIKNSIRDGVGFLKLDDFANQVEFADLTTAFNNKIKNEIIFDREAKDYLDKNISFFGCISLQNTDPESLVVVPVELNIMEN